MEKQPISREGYDKLRDEIRRLEDEEMPRIAAQIALARAEGDLSEDEMGGPATFNVPRATRRSTTLLP